MKRSDIHSFKLWPQSRNAVKLRGEPLDPVLWQGSQWAVTEYGLEKRDGCYHVAAADLWLFARADSAQEVFVHWWKHLSGKCWCDADDVDSALQAMLVLFDRNGNRTSVPAPTLMSEDDIENFALQAGDQAYSNAKLRALNGLP